MAAATVPSIYASALLEYADDVGKRQEVIAEALELALTLEGHPELVAAVEGSELSRDQGKGLVRSVFEDRVTDPILRFLQLLVDRGRFAFAPAILRESVALHEESLGVVKVHVTSAATLTEATKAKVETAMKKDVGSAAIFTYSVDDSIVGGLQIRYGDTLVDASLRRLITDLNSHIRQTPLDGVVVETGTREIHR